MLNDAVFYNEHIKNTIVAFGSLFSNIKIQRKNNEGVIEQTLQIPIAYSQKEKWVHSIEANPDNDRGIYTALPRLGFEINGYSYDASRKLAKMNKVYCVDGDTRSQMFTPVPYNIELSLYFATKTQSDALQILEQILPTFSPDYTMSIVAIQDAGIVQDVPFILNSVSVQDDYEGDLATRRFVLHTLSFTAKINLFGGRGNVGLIKQVKADVSTANIAAPERSFVAVQASPVAAVSENWMDNF